jgi:hypothetical protein
MSLVPGCHQPLAVVAAVTLLGCTGESTRTFQTVTSEQPGALLSAFVASDGTAYLAGGVTGGGPGLLLRWDRRGVTSIPVGAAHAFWWIHGVADGDMWLAGESGEVHRFDGATLTTVDVGADPTAVLFGIWGTSSEDLWTVGGSLVSGGPRRIVLRGTAGSWSPIASPDGVDADVTYYKVWGPSAADVWIVGDRGVVLRGQGAGLLRVDAPGAERYVTVHGCAPDDVYAVGGGGSGVAIHYDGTAWTSIALLNVPLLSGVACTNGAAYVGGFSAYAALLRQPRPLILAMPPALADLAIHGVAVGPGGQVVAVGGDLGAGTNDPQRGFAAELVP